MDQVDQEDNSNSPFCNDCEWVAPLAGSSLRCEKCGNALSVFDQNGNILIWDGQRPSAIVVQQEKPKNSPNLILTLGILGFILCPVFGWIAYFWGRSDLKKMDNGMMDSSGRNKTYIGRSLGMFIFLFPIGVLIACMLYFAIVSVLGW